MSKKRLVRERLCFHRWEDRLGLLSRKVGSSGSPERHLVRGVTLLFWASQCPQGSGVHICLSCCTTWQLLPQFCTLLIPSAGVRESKTKAQNMRNSTYRGSRDPVRKALSPQQDLTVSTSAGHPWGDALSSTASPGHVRRAEPGIHNPHLLATCRCTMCVSLPC